MDSAFILRYQESCTEGDSASCVAGTTTKTKTLGEQADLDQTLVSGTQTVTRVANEQGDADSTKKLTTLPRHSVEMGTKTATAVKAESPDNDRGQTLYQVLSR